jgi:hypothetical protein
VTFLREAATGITLPVWLREVSHVDDEVSVDGSIRRLSTVLDESGGRIRMRADLLAMTFVEK